MSKIDLILKRFIEKIHTSDIKDSYISIYQEYEDSFRYVFAYLHQQLNDLLETLNRKNQMNKHYNAEPSRELLNVVSNLEELNRELNVYGEEIVLSSSYQKVLDLIRPFLRVSGGSQIPDDFSGVHIEYYDPIFSTTTKKILIVNKTQDIDLKVIGEGAFSIVSRYKDPSYDKYFAVKKLKKNVTGREKERFKKEFNILQRLNFPYVLKVYRFDETKYSYTMDYCENTLSNYITKNNSKLSFNLRKRVLLQFLYGVNYLHSKKILHRDISYNNILVQEFDGAVMIKLSDFGLMKDEESDFTKTETEIKGTIIDPSLHSFKDYTLANEIYAIGFIINFIFTGRKSLQSREDHLNPIIEKCTTLDLGKRYKLINDIITDIELLVD